MKRIMHRTMGLATVVAIVGFHGTAVAQNEKTYAKAEADIDAETPVGRAKVMADNADTAMFEKNFPKACRLYEMSLALHPDPGTELAFIECLVKMGLYGDAYGRMVDAASKVAESEPESKKWALERAAEIKKEAPCIMIDVPTGPREISGIEVTLDGIAIPPASWNAVCTAVNLNYHNVAVRAPLKAWTRQRVATFDPGQRYTVTIANPYSTEKAPAVQRSSSIGTGPIGTTLFIVGGVAAAGACIVTPLAAKKDGEVVAGSAICGGGVAMALSGLLLLGMATSDKPSSQAMISISPSLHGINVSGRF